MYYRITVSRKGYHLFATAKRSLRGKTQAMNLYVELKEKFPDCLITVTSWEEIGTTLTEEFDEVIAGSVR